MDELLENWFDDVGILSQSSALVRRKDGELVTGIVILTDGSEIVLERKQLQSALESLNKDIKS